MHRERVFFELEGRNNLNVNVDACFKYKPGKAGGKPSGERPPSIWQGIGGIFSAEGKKKNRGKGA